MTGGVKAWVAVPAAVPAAAPATVPATDLATPVLSTASIDLVVAKVASLWRAVAIGSTPEGIPLADGLAVLAANAEFVFAPVEARPPLARATDALVAAMRELDLALDRRVTGMVGTGADVIVFRRIADRGACLAVTGYWMVLEQNGSLYTKFDRVKGAF